MTTLTKHLGTKPTSVCIGIADHTGLPPSPHDSHGSPSGTPTPMHALLPSPPIVTALLSEDLFPPRPAKKSIPMKKHDEEQEDFNCSSPEDEDSEGEESERDKDPLAAQIWRLYTKAKDNLPHGARLENLTWRMMAMKLSKRRNENEKNNSLKKRAGSAPTIINANRDTAAKVSASTSAAVKVDMAPEPCSNAAKANPDSLRSSYMLPRHSAPSITIPHDLSSDDESETEQGYHEIKVSGKNTYTSVSCSSAISSAMSKPQLGSRSNSTPIATINSGARNPLVTAIPITMAAMNRNPVGRSTLMTPPESEGEFFDHHFAAMNTPSTTLGNPTDAILANLSFEQLVDLYATSEGNEGATVAPSSTMADGSDSGAMAMLPKRDNKMKAGTTALLRFEELHARHGRGGLPGDGGGGDDVGGLHALGGSEESASPSASTSTATKKSSLKQRTLETEQRSGVSCSNCATRTTPLWRRSPDGQTLCNACGLFLKLHGVVRPLSLKTDVIRKRNRKEKSGKEADGAPGLGVKRPKIEKDSNPGNVPTIPVSAAGGEGPRGPSAMNKTGPHLPSVNTSSATANVDPRMMQLAWMAAMARMNGMVGDMNVPGGGGNVSGGEDEWKQLLFARATAAAMLAMQRLSS
ncbi:uncharacterized protein VTP21DRAFT_1199 [Calcarisporiella thermophila]|uniref:uncharacterized protein n=1 Tax=Calcarisporiella thermophila TaxID=911321 RepID=UPI003743289C